MRGMRRGNYCLWSTEELAEDRVGRNYARKSRSPSGVHDSSDSSGVRSFSSQAHPLKGLRGSFVLIRTERLMVLLNNIVSLLVLISGTY